MAFTFLSITDLIRRVACAAALTAGCGGGASEAEPGTLTAPLATMTPQTTHFVAAIPMAALGCGPRPHNYYLTTKLWVDTERANLAAFAPNWQLGHDRDELEFELHPLGKDCTELDRLHMLADDGGTLYAKGVRTVGSGIWAGRWNWWVGEAQRQICHAGFVDRIEVQLDDLFTIAWEWRVPTISWRQPDSEPCDVAPPDAAPAHSEDGYVYTSLPSDRALRCDATEAGYRLWLNPRQSNVLLGPAHGVYQRMSSVEVFASVAACEDARAVMLQEATQLAPTRKAWLVLLQEATQLAPRHNGIEVPATRKAWLVQPRGTSVPTAYVQEVRCKISGRAFVLTQRFALSS